MSDPASVHAPACVLDGDGLDGLPFLLEAAAAEAAPAADDTASDAVTLRLPVVPAIAAPSTPVRTPHAPRSRRVLTAIGIGAAATLLAAGLALLTPPHPGGRGHNSIAASTTASAPRRAKALTPEPGAHAVQRDTAPPPQHEAPRAHAPPRVVPAPSTPQVVAHFGLESAVVREADRASIHRLAASCHGRIRLTGHACSRGSARANRSIGRRRAKAVAKVLTAAGVAAERVDITTAGETSPLPTADAQHPLNRRVSAVCTD